MQQAALLDGIGFDLLSVFEDGFGPAEIDVGRCEVAQALVVAVMVVVVDEAADRRLQSAGQVVRAPFPPAFHVPRPPQTPLRQST